MSDIKYNQFGEVVSVNGLTTGHHIGAPMQDALGSEVDNSPYGVEKQVVRPTCKQTNDELQPTHPTGGVTCWSDLTDKPFGEKTVMGDTLTWDGNTEGRTKVFVDEYQDFVYVSDNIPTIEDLQNAVTMVSKCGDRTETWKLEPDWIVDHDDYIDVDGTFITKMDNVTVSVFEGNREVTLPKAGIYFWWVHGDGEWLESLTINGYNGFPRTEITPLPNKYLDIVETVGNGDTLTWDGSTDGLLVIRDTDDRTYAKVSDILPNDPSVIKNISYNIRGDVINKVSGDDIMSYENYISIDGEVYIVFEDGVTDEYDEEDYHWSIYFPKKGIYFGFYETDPYHHVQTFTINGYTGFPKEQVIKQNYLPTLSKYSTKVFDLSQFCWDRLNESFVNLTTEVAPSCNITKEALMELIDAHKTGHLFIDTESQTTLRVNGCGSNSDDLCIIFTGNDFKASPSRSDVMLHAFSKKFRYNEELGVVEISSDDKQFKIATTVV